MHARWLAVSLCIVVTVVGVIDAADEDSGVGKSLAHSRELRKKVPNVEMAQKQVLAENDDAPASKAVAGTASQAPLVGSPKAPVDASSVPVNPSAAPGIPTNAPVNPLPASGIPSNAPGIPTFAPAPLNPSNAPVNPSDVPQNPTDAPQKPSVEFENPSLAPANPSALPRSEAPPNPSALPGSEAPKVSPTTPQPTTFPPMNGERLAIEPYLDDLFQFENSLIRDHKVGVHWEIYDGKGLGYDDYIFHSMLGSIVQAGPKTRAYHLPGHKCGGLKKLYQYFNATDNTHRVTLNFRQTTNKGDRQPIGMCAARKGQCGADLPLYVYYGTHNVSGKVKPSYFYSTDKNYTFMPDKANYKLVSDEPLCYIYTRSENRTLEDRITNPNQTLHLRNLHTEIIPIYELIANENLWYDTKITPGYEAGFKRHAFNLFKNSTLLANACPVRPVDDFNYFVPVSPTGQYSTDVLVTTDEDAEVRRKNTTMYRAEQLLGWGLGASRACGGRIHYKIYQRPANLSSMANTVYVARAGQKESPADGEYIVGSFFYSI